MIILTEGYGRLANRIIQYAHLIAFCKENNLEIYNPSFIEYSHYFKGSFSQRIPHFTPNIRNSNKRYKNGFFMKLINFLLKIFSRLFKNGFLTKNIGLINFDIKDISKEEFLNLAKSKKYFFITGWNFRDYENVEKHYETIRDYFEPVAEYKEKVDNFIKPLRNNYDTLIALHIRRGDYKDFIDGKYFFSDEIYLSFLKQLKTFLNNNTLFIIFSDEEIDISYYRNNNLNVIQAKGDAITDLYSMACCDYIIGTVSTFNLWAAYYGKKKHKYIENKDEIIKLTDFQILRTL